MRSLLRLLKMIVVIEVIGACLLCGARLRRPAIPAVNLDALDAVTAETIRTLERQMGEETVDNWIALAKAYTVFGYFPAAEQCCRRAAELEPDSVNVHLWWGIAADRLGQIDEAIAHFNRVAELATAERAEMAQYEIGRNWLRREDAIAAEAAFRKAGNDGRARFALAQLLVRSNRLEEASELLDELLATNPLQHKLHQLRARVAGLQGDVRTEAKHRDWAEHAPQDFSSDTIAYFLTNEAEKYGVRNQSSTGQRLLRSNQPAAAETILHEALAVEWNPEVADSLVTLALSRRAPDEALRLVDELIQRDGLDVKALQDRGSALLMQGRESEAIEQWERATRIGHSAEAHLKLADAYERRNEPERSQRHRALANLEQGAAAFRLDQLQHATESLEQAVKLDPDLAHAWYYLAECRRFLGKLMPAESAYRRCLELNPDHGRALTGLEHLELERTSTE